MKPVRFLGDSLKRVREFPAGAMHEAGYQLDKVQRGKQPDDFKIYTARISDAVYVLHAFQKKTQTTSKHDIEIAKQGYTELMGGQK